MFSGFLLNGIAWCRSWGAPGFAAGVIQRAQGGLSRPKLCQSSVRMPEAVAWQRKGRHRTVGTMVAIWPVLCNPWRHRVTCSRSSPAAVSIETPEESAPRDSNYTGSRKAPQKAYSIHLFPFILCSRQSVRLELRCCTEVIWGVVFISFTGRLFQGRITLELKLMVSDDKLSHIPASATHSHLCSPGEGINTCSQELSGRAAPS